jgi:sugar phosphate permease
MKNKSKKIKYNSDQIKVTSTSFFSLFSIVGIMFYGLPFFFDFWVKDFGWSHATVTSGNLAGKIIIGPLFGFAAGWFIDKFGPRRLMLAGIVMAGIAVMGFSFMTSLWHFYACYLLVALGYMCGGPLPNQVLISRWFNVSRGKAMGIAYLGIGFGGMLVPQIARYLNKNIGWNNAMIGLGCLIIIIAFPMAWSVKENPKNKLNKSNSRPQITPLKTIFKSKSFYLLTIGSMCSIGVVAGISQNLKLLFSLDLNYSQSQAANVFSLVLASSIIGRLLMGWLADKYGKKTTMLLIYSIITISIFLLYYAKIPGVIYAFAFLFGIGLGGDYMIIPLMAAELFGVKVMGRIMGLILTFDGLAEACGPMLVGGLRDYTGNNTIGYTVLILISIIGVITITLLKNTNEDTNLKPQLRKLD